MSYSESLIEENQDKSLGQEKAVLYIGLTISSIM